MKPTKRPQPPKCADCDRKLPSSHPRIQYGNIWRCPDCSYRLEQQRVRDRLTARHGTPA